MPISPPASNVLQDPTFNPIAGVSVTISNPATGAKVEIYNADGTNKANPFVTGPTGDATFYAADGVYLRTCRIGGRTYSTDSLIVGSPPQFVGPAGHDGTGLPGITPDTFGGAADLQLATFQGPIQGVATDNLAPLNNALASVTYSPDKPDGALYQMTAPIALGLGGRLLSATWEYRSTVKVNGSGGGHDYVNGSLLYTPANQTGIRLAARFSQNGAYSSTDSGRHSGGSHVDSIYLLSAGGTDITAHGIRAMEPLFLTFTTVEQYPGNGIDLTGNSNFTTPGNTAYGNSNGSFTMRNIIRGVQRHGIVNSGVDSNATLHLGNQIKSCGGTAIVDNGAYANTHVAPEIDGSGGNGLGRCNHNGRNYVLLVDDSRATSVEPGVGPGNHWMVWLDEGAQANPSSYWPAWSATATYQCGIAYLSTSETNHGSLIAPYVEAGAQGIVNVAGSQIVLNGEGFYTKDTPHLFVQQGGGATRRAIYSRIGIGARRDHYQEPGYLAAFGAYSICAIGTADGGYTDIIFENEKDGRNSLFLDGAGRLSLSRGTPGGGNVAIFSATLTRCTDTFGRGAPVPDVMSFSNFAMALPNNPSGARIFALTTATPTDAGARGERRYFSELAKGGVASWGRDNNGTWQPIGIVGAVQATGLSSSSTAAQIVAALQAAGLAA